MPSLVEPSPAPTPRMPSMGGTPKARLKSKPAPSTQNVQIAHQQINVDISFQHKKLSGYTELTVIPTAANVRSLRLDAREMKIQKVLFNGSEVDFLHDDELYINNGETFDDYARRKVPNVWDEYSRDFSIHQHHLLRQKLSHIFGHIDEQQLQAPHFNPNTEELVIFFPEKYRVEAADSATPIRTGMSATPLQRFKHADVYAPIQIGIYYEVANPRNGLNFVTGDALDRSLWHVYTSNSEYHLSTSSWVPCIDNFLQRSSWSLELSIPRSVRDIFSEQNTDEDDEENHDLVVCSGDFVNAKESPHPSDLSKKVVSWSIFNPICAHHVGWAVGAFQSMELAGFEDLAAQDDMDEVIEVKDDTSVPVLLYYLPGQQKMAHNTCIFARHAVDHFSKEYGSYPFSSFGLVFVHDTPYPCSNFAGLSQFSSDLLYPEDIIEPMFSVTEQIVDCIAGQWSGINIIPQTLNDLWCTVGIAKYMTLQFTRTLMGSNECRYQIRQRMDAIVEQDVGQRPLGAQVLEAPISERNFDFLRLKAPIIMFILDRRMTKTDKSFGFSRVLPKLFLQAMSGDMQNGALSTGHFQYVCEKVNRNRLDSFFKQWVYGVGAPIFNITQKFNKKRSMIEVSIRQSQLQQRESPHPKTETFMRDAANFLNDEQSYPVQQTFVGPMTLRVHEADGTPYEHIVDIKDSVVKFDVQYNTKFKRLKKNKDDGDQSVFSRLGDVLDSEEDSRDWKFEDWPKRDEEFLDPFEWIRVDTDFEWIATVRVIQPDYMYGAQLQQDRDIEAQLSAIEYFSSREKPSRIYCTLLTRTLLDSRYFYGVRINAARALAAMSTAATHFLGLDYLIRAFRQMFCFENSYIPKSNDFSDFGVFFLQKSIPGFLAKVKDDDGNSPPVVRNLLYNLLKYNDNSNNDFQDCFYVASLVQAVVHAVVHEIPSNIDLHLEKELRTEAPSKFVRRVIEEVGRIHKLDRHVPSYHHVVSEACLVQKILLARCNLVDLSLEELLQMTHYKNEPAVRKAAFKGLFVLGGLKNSEVMDYFLHVCLLENTSGSFRSGLISVLTESISEAAIHGIPSNLDDPEFKSLETFYDNKGNSGNMVIVEESLGSEASSRRDAIAKATVKGSISVLRRDLAIGNGLKNALWELLHSSLLSLYDKKLVFLVSDVLYEAVGSFPVHIPVPCVSFDELKKKIVAKYLGDGKVVIKREGRFRIQLSTRIDSNKLKIKLDRPKRRDVVDVPEVSQAAGVSEAPKVLAPEVATPKAAVPKAATPKSVAPKAGEVSVATLDAPSQENGVDEMDVEEVQAPQDTSQAQLVTRDVHNRFRVTFRLKKAPVSVHGTTVRIRIAPLRFIRINTKEGSVQASRQPFPKRGGFGFGSIPKVESEKRRVEEDVNEAKSGVEDASKEKKSGEDASKEKKFGEEASNQEKSSESNNQSIGKLKHHSPEEKTENLKKSEIKQPEKEPEAEAFSRAASPFAEPVKVPKKKKKIYIHSRSNTPSPDTVDGQKADLDQKGSHNAKDDDAQNSQKGASPAKESQDNGKEKTKEAGIEERSSDNTKANDRKEEDGPKPKLKLKLSLK